MYSRCKASIGQTSLIMEIVSNSMVKLFIWCAAWDNTNFYKSVAIGYVLRKQHHLLLMHFYSTEVITLKYNSLLLFVKRPIMPT